MVDSLFELGPIKKAEVSFVYDDHASSPPPGQRLKMLLSNASVLVSDDGVDWSLGSSSAPTAPRAPLQPHAYCALPCV